MKFEVQHADCGYGGSCILRDISLSIESGSILCLLGPNGVGKTTLFKSMLGFLKLKAGRILIDGEDISTWTIKKTAKTIGYVPQVHTPPFPFTVIDVVAMGRVAHMGVFGTPGAKDMAEADYALERLGITGFRDKIYTEISGGERQMVLIARALAQHPKILIMDEPTSNLDFGNQIRVLTQIKALAIDGLAVIMTSHFPNHAFLCSTDVGLLKRDSPLIVGQADEVVTEENLRAAYGVDVCIIRQQITGREWLTSCVPVITQQNNPAPKRCAVI
jgi:iron complex transport system ATP-binding protein